MRHRQMYNAVLEKRHQLRAAGALSVPDEAGSRVAILVPFIAEVVQAPGDDRANFERQTAELIDYYTARGREPYAIMDARREDFARVLGDMSVPTVVVAGFGNISAIAVPIPAEADRPAGYGYLDWLHLADMATHLKLGKFVMLQCGGYNRTFNPPLPVGVVSSHADIYGIAGRGRVAADGIRGDPPKQLTPLEELSYDHIRISYQLHRNRDLGRPLPDRIYEAARDAYNQHLNPDRGQLPEPIKIPHPDFRAYHAK